MAAALLPLGIPILPETGAADIAVQEERIAAQLEHAAPEDLVAALLQKVSRLCLLLVVDQLEELFHLPDEVVQQFGATLGRLARAQRPGGGPMVRLLLTVRIDAAHRVETLTGYEVGSLMKLKPPGPSALRQAIENPVRRSGFAHYEPGLVDEIVNDLHDKPYCLPVLQVLLSHLWERQTEHGLLSHEVYRGLRGGAGPIATHLDRVWDEDLSEDERTAGLGLLLHLVVPLEGGRHARRAAAVGELDPAQRRVADTLATTRMLTTGGGPGEAAMIELAHEALIEEWPRLREWVIDHDDLLRWRDALRRRMLLWDRSGQHRSALLGGPELKQGMDWLAGHPTSLSEVERSFIQTSVQARGRELVRTLLVTAVITFLVVGLGGMGGFWWLRDQAERQRDGIARSERIAGQIRELDNTRYQALIATGAFDAADTTAARSLLEKSYHDFQFVTRSFPPWRTTDYRDLTVLSADRRVQVTASYRTGLVHWLDLAAVADGRPPEPVELPVDRSPDEAPPSVAVTADGSTIATSVGDRITIWDRTTGRARTSYSVPTGRAWAIALDPTATVLSYIDETTVHWIDAQSGRQVNRPLKLPPRGVNDRMAPQLTTGRGAATTVVSYSGSTWLVGRADRSVRTLPDLDTTSRKEGGQVIQTTTRTTITGITTDSSQLVVCHSRQETIREAEDSDVAGGSGSEREDDGSMAPDAGPRAVQARFELWDLTSSAVRPLVDLPRRGCGSALLDPSGNVLALVEEPPLGQETLTGQYELSFWSVPQGAKLGRFRAPTDLLLDFVRHSDRWEVLLTDFDGRLDLLRIPPMGTLDFALTIAHLARYTPDGRTVVTQTSEGRLASWDGRTGHQLGEVQAPPPDTRLGSADERLMWIAPDGGHVITVADTGDRLDVWHLPDLSHGVTLRPPRRPVPQRPELGGPETPQADELAVGFVGGDEVVVYGDGTVTRWDRRTGQPRGRAWELGERNPVYARTVKIHPDGLLFTVDPNTSQVLRWDTETGAVTDAGIPDPGDPGLQVYYLMVAPDARRVALAYSEGPVILWDTEDRRQLARIDKDAASEPRYHLDDPFRLGIVGGGGLSWWRPEPANAFTRFWDRTPEPRLLPAAVHDLRPDGKELINGWPGVPLRRVSTDPNTWYRHLCRVLAEPSTAEVSWLDDRLPAERCSSE
nr:WD40 repeat domain-containing protein [Micromonospora sagamiensis]